MRRILGAFRSLTLWLALLSPQAMAQPAPDGPPAVGVVRVERQQIAETEEFIGRIQAVGRISLVARVTAGSATAHAVQWRNLRRVEFMTCPRKRHTTEASPILNPA